MVIVDELLVLGVLDAVLRHCVHVVEPEELVRAFRKLHTEVFLGTTSVSSSIETVLNLVNAIGAGSEQDHGPPDPLCCHKTS